MIDKCLKFKAGDIVKIDEVSPKGTIGVVSPKGTIGVVLKGEYGIIVRIMSTGYLIDCSNSYFLAGVSDDNLLEATKKEKEIFKRKLVENEI